MITSPKIAVKPPLSYNFNHNVQKSYRLFNWLALPDETVTGYKYSFPFLSAECGVTVQDNCVQPLYKQLVHVHKPSLCFVGLPFYVCAFTMFDIQASVVVIKGITGSFCCLKPSVFKSYLTLFYGTYNFVC